MRTALIAGSMFVLVGCSESFGAFATNPCVTPIDVEVASTDGGDPQLVTVEAQQRAEVWSYCCAPGVDGELTLSVGDWSTSVTFDELREDGSVVVPQSACPIT